MQQSVRVRQTDVWRLAAEAHRDPKTVQRALEGGGTSLTRQAIVEAAKRLNIPLPTDFAIDR